MSDHGDCPKGRNHTGKLALIFSILALVIASTGTAVAVTGGAFVLGKPNAAKATTSLKNPKGTALSLRSKAGAPSLTVNSRSKVARLNADLLDGLDSSVFARKANVLPDWSGYTIMVAGIRCPRGTTSSMKGWYGAENQISANFGTYLYAVEYSDLFSTYRLRRDAQPLLMTPCSIP